ncbi:MAG: AAA family ATPase [Nocardioides sp.]
MDHNIYSPGAGHQPPLLAGREAPLARWQRMLSELEFRGRVGGEDLILCGPRGVGKTVLMSRFAVIADQLDYEVIQYQAAAGNVGLVEAVARRAASRLDAQVSVWAKVRRSFENVAGVSLGAAGVSASLSLRSAPQEAFTRDASDVAHALADLASAVREERPTGGVLLAVDELQVSAKTDLTLLATMLQRLNVERPDARVAFASTALPHIYRVLEAAGVTHPDRLLPQESIPTALLTEHATAAVVEPALKAGVAWEPTAVDAVVRESGGHPAHLQLMAAETWETAEGPGRITAADAAVGIARSLDAIRAGNFEATWEGLSPGQRDYLAALSTAGGRATTATIVHALGAKSAQDLSDVREILLERGLVRAPRRGLVEFAVPAMAGYVAEQLTAAAGTRPPDRPPEVGRANEARLPPGGGS